jgi:hypothetical protein
LAVNPDFWREQLHIDRFTDLLMDLSLQSWSRWLHIP